MLKPFGLIDYLMPSSTTG